MDTSVDDYIAVASYNTSFASDLGKAIGSEGNFLSSQVADGAPVAPGTDVGRTYFINAINQVEDFFHQYGKKAVIGLQEINWMNHTEEQIKHKPYQTNQGYMYKKGDNINPKNLPEEEYAGSLYIYNRLQKIDKDIAVCVAGVYSLKVAQPSLIIAFNKGKFGNPTTMEIMEITTPGEGDGEIHDPQKKGRPAFYVITNEGYLFINLHAPNQDGIHEYVYKRLNKIFNYIIKKHGHIDENKIFIMGDFNDPYNYFKKLELNGAIMTHTSEFCPNYIKKKSCCYNLNSSGKEARKQPIGTGTIVDAYGRPEDTFVFNHKNGFNRGEGPGFLTDKGSYQTMDDEGSIEYYGFTGDYVFGRRPMTNLDIYKGPGPNASPPAIFQSYGEKISTRSDHEMVFCLYHAPPKVNVGGRRQTKRRRSRKKIYIKIKNKQKKENVEKKQRLTKKRKPRKRKQTKRKQTKR